MVKKMIQCPKCSHEQVLSTECESCGVIFSKYIQYQKKRQERLEAEERKRKSKAKRMRSVIQTIVLIAITAGTTYWFVRPETNPVPQQVAEVVTAPVVSEDQQKTSPEKSENKSIKKQTQPAVAMRGGSIEQARRATVSIETPWGTGSGFFVNDNYIVTNRHVLEIDQDELAEFRRNVESTRELVELEKEKLQDFRARARSMSKGPARSQLKIIIEERERELNKVLPELEDAERRLAKMEERVGPSDIKIILADGSSHVADYLLLSDKHDLALMSLFANRTNYLKRPPANYSIRQGDKVFTIGSPVGLRNTVTSGIFSGYRRDDTNGKVFLQTDAAINPGNSGGPLIDEQGYVHGVNTMILQNTEGIGFAIPIETVYEEFGSSLF